LFSIEWQLTFKENSMRLFQEIARRQVGGFVLMSGLIVSLCTTLHAQRANDGQGVDKATFQLLMARIDQLETRVRQLEAEKPRPVAESGSRSNVAANLPESAIAAPVPSVGVSQTSAAAMPPSSSAQESDQNQSENTMAERMDISKTLLRIRGFGDISFHGSTRKGDTTSFSLGQLDLFVTSDISDKFKFIGEIVFEAGANDYYGVTSGTNNTFGVDVERYLLQYSHNDYFNISAGRVHTAIGYYNTAYHHSTWLQTTAGRPFLFDFEDHGGILPIHTVGVSASGLIPSGRLGLHYVAEVGNGRASRTPLVEEPVQNEIDDQNRKAFNFAAFVRPEAIPGLQTGLSVYRNVLAPSNAPKVGEIILAGHAVLIRPRYEWLNEALLDHHAVAGTSRVFNTPGFYSQISKQFGDYRPYLRYQYVNVARNEPVFPDVALRHGPSLGLRFDASESVALKLQYDYTFLRSQPGVGALNLQIGFTF
jgi:hypothetical protein